MTQTKKKTKKINTQRIDKYEINGTPAGLARTRKIIRTEKDLEIQFIKLCCQIKLDDYKQDRAQFQRNERLNKRKK